MQFPTVGCLEVTAAVPSHGKLQVQYLQTDAALQAQMTCVLWPWAARYDTGLLNKLTPKGVAFSFLSPCCGFQHSKEPAVHTHCADTVGSLYVGSHNMHVI